ncbi:MAG: hypothetical protein JST92_02460, partial [Deltaproteobacteria bacterium]|nr:hypothetical protein [Deltaproteobacteria bacterium]
MPNQPGDDLGRAHKDRGTALLGKGKIDAALKEFELAVLAQPGDVVARRKVAELCARLGRISDAVAAYQHLAGRFAAEGRLVQAIAVCKVILQLDAKHEETQRTLSRLYSKRTEPGGKRPTDRPLPGSPLSSSPDSTGELALDTSEYDPTRSGEREAMPATMAGAIEFSDSGAVRMLPKPLPALPGLQGVSSASPRRNEAAPEQPVQASQAPSPQVPQTPSTQAPSEPPAATHEVEIVVGELPQTPLFSELPAPIMQALLETLIMVPYEPGQEILVEGETG